MNQQPNPPLQQPTPQGYQPVQPLHGATTPQPPAPTDAEAAAKHANSKAKYPEVTLSSQEYVIEFVRRHPIGLLSIWALVTLVSLLIIGLLPLYAANHAMLQRELGFSLPSAAAMALPLLLAVLFFLVGGYIATIVYLGNRFYLTNESVIQHVRTSLFNNKNQIINLVNVEDASFEKKGILQQLFNYGTLRLSTQGEETIYRFYYVTNPDRVVHAVNEAVEVAMRNLEGDLRTHQIRE